MNLIYIFSATTDPCTAIFNAGIGEYSLARWYYNATSRKCLPFNYKGSRGGQNNFLTRDECEQRCPGIHNLMFDVCYYVRLSTIAYDNPCRVGGPFLLASTNQPQSCSPKSPCPEHYYCHIGINDAYLCCPSSKSLIYIRTNDPIERKCCESCKKD